MPDPKRLREHPQRGQAWALRDQDENMLLPADARVKVYADKANGDFRNEIADNLRERVRFLRSAACQIPLRGGLIH